MVAPLLALLAQGITPERLAWSLAIGATIGILPVLGATTLLCTVAALWLRLNLVAMQLANYLVYPLQIALVLPFVRAGERLFGGPRLPLSGPQLLQLAHEQGWRSFETLGRSGLQATTVWLLIGPPLALGLFAALRPALQRLRR